MVRIFFFFILFIALKDACVGQTQPVYRSKYTVARDGSGDFKTIAEAMKACKAFPDERITIHIKPGKYQEKVEVFSWTPRVSWIGENAETTIVTFGDYSGKEGINTFNSYTVKILGNDFYAENITFENSAGPVGQAVALHIEADRCVFRNCRFIGHQDTMYAGGEGSRQYYKDCYIEGTTDFIFGAATAVFENCHIHCKKNSYITAASTPEGKPYGYVFLNCAITATPEVTKLYLGRPWRNFARTVFINCSMGSFLLPEGWHNWNKPEAEKTAFYAEYNSTGEGANPQKRVAWSRQLTAEEVKKYTVTGILKGTDGWDPETKRP